MATFPEEKSKWVALPRAGGGKNCCRVSLVFVSFREGFITVCCQTRLRIRSEFGGLFTGFWWLVFCCTLILLFPLWASCAEVADDAMNAEAPFQSHWRVTKSLDFPSRKSLWNKTPKCQFTKQLQHDFLGQLINLWHQQCVECLPLSQECRCMDMCGLQGILSADALQKYFVPVNVRIFQGNCRGKESGSFPSPWLGVVGVVAQMRNFSSS